ncbi:hypothetical protein IH824_12920 [candidate division KSB1 bacterium]|nr:hypothetical protein [candidate division KSB1 bacterium]
MVIVEIIQAYPKWSIIVIALLVSLFISLINYFVLDKDKMKEMNEKKQITFLFSTHDPMVMERARRLVILRDGQIAEDKRN